MSGSEAHAADARFALSPDQRIAWQRARDLLTSAREAGLEALGIGPDELGCDCCGIVVALSDATHEDRYGNEWTLCPECRDGGMWARGLWCCARGHRYQALIKVRDALRELDAVGAS